MRRAALFMILLVLPTLFLNSSAQVRFYLYGGGSFAPGDNVVLNTWLDRPLAGELTLYGIDDPGQVQRLGGPMQFEASEQLEMTELRTFGVTSTRTGTVEIEIGPLPPGMYFAQLTEGGVSGATLILVTDLALVVKSDASDLLVYTADLVTGEPRPATVHAFGDTHETGADGVIMVPVPVDAGSEREVAATAGDSWAFNDIWWSNWGVEQPLTYIVTDRSVYRPGQTVMLKGTVRGSRTVTPVSGSTATLSVTDADYVEIHRAELTTDDYGSFETELILPDYAPIGYYSVRVTVDDRSSWGSFWVEEYELPEYEVIVAVGEDHAIQGDTVSFTVDARYLFGGPVAGAAVDYVVMEQEFSPFAWRSRHGFYDDSSHTWGGNVIARGEATLGADGTLELPFTLPALDHDYRLTLQAGVWDESNREISGSASLIGYRADLTFGIDTQRYAHPLGDRIEVTISAADLEGNPLSTDFELVSQRHYWEGDSARSEPGPVFSGTTAADGRATIAFTPEAAGSWELVARGADDAGRVTDRSRFIWVYGSSAWYWDYQSLEIEADKPEYRVGETARFVIRSPVADSTALITHEGNGLGHWELVSFEGNSLTVELAVTDDSFPNSHLGVVVVGGGSMYSSFVSYHVDPGEKFLDIAVESDAEVYEPGTTGEFSVHVTDQAGSGVQAQLTLALVDDALFLVRRDPAQDIREYFYSWRGNVVSTSLSSFAWFGQAAPVGVAREPMTEAVFGQGKEAAREAAADLEEARLREDFLETIAWLPTVETDLDGRASFTVEFPDNLTRWRLTARAVTAADQVGQATHTVTTTLPVLARLSMPAYLIRGDESQLRVIGQSNLDAPVRARLGLDAEGLEIIGPESSVELTLAPAERVTADYRVRATEPGTAYVTAEVLTEEASDALRLELPVLPHAIRSEIAHSGEGDTGWDFRVPETVTRLAGTVTVTPSLTGAVTASLEYLIGTPYGGAEQTLNRFLPSLLTVRAGREELLPQDVAENLDDYVAEGVRRLQDLQHGDGGWGFWYWDVSHPAISADVIIALLEASDAGYAVSSWVLDRGVDYLESAVTNEAYQVHDDLTGEQNLAATADTKAWIWYALAKAGRPTDPLSEVAGSEHLSNHGLAVSVLAFHAAGQVAEAQLHLDELLSRVSESEASAYWDSGAPRFTWGDDRVGTTARVLQGLAELRPEEPLIAKVVNWLMLERQGTHWYSTRDTAAVVAAALALDADAGPDVRTVTLTGSSGVDRVVELGNVAITLDVTDLLAPGGNSLSISAPAGVFTSASVEYHAEGEFPSEVAEGLGVTRSYEALRPVWDASEERIEYERSSATSFEVGDFILVSVTLSPQGRYRYVLVNEPIPAGFSVVEEDRPFRISGIAPRYGEDYWGWNHWYDGRVIQRAHVDYYFWRVNNPVTFTYILRADHPGRFTALPTTAWLMYEPDIAGRSAQSRLEVLPQE